MLKSMTAYAQVSRVAHAFKLTCELKSVNSRYFDLRCNLPAALQSEELAIRQFLHQEIKRGKVDCSLQLQVLATEAAENLDWEKVEVKLTQLLALDAFLQQKVPNYQSDAAQYLTILSKDNSLFANNSYSEQQIATLFSLKDEVLNACLQEFISVRLWEGEQLAKDILSRIKTMEELVQEIAAVNETAPYQHFARLKERLQELLQNTELAHDDSRLQLEIALLADKHDVTEETTRLASHFKRFKQLCAAQEAGGKNLDFLLQEINREINTIGSKANDLHITEQVVILKTELEKIREQVQNVE